ncbi:transcriptional regulator, XRE family [Jannaschia faecimaris]|uniref:Transcriptional regulator, XRE family n=2 Tax=Jannaschia faecimaris TaxID=1244108 RepID=A0A1H3RBA5_9RHOB|nr:transcriptional regulator, XRE family [Jannaschia faecimaris]
MLGLKQAGVAATVGISPSYLNLIEHNRRAIGGALLTRLADALGTDRAALAEDGDAALIEGVRNAGAVGKIDAEALSEAATLTQRHPAWARLIVAQAEALAAQARTVEALSDRLSHDPTLADAMHEMLSTVSVVRSTASILAQTPEIDANWLRRFLANLDSDSRRLADGVEAVMALFDGRATQGGERLLPSEIVSRFLDDAGHRFAALEEQGATAVASLVAPIADPAARALAADVLRGDAEDAARLPRALVEAAEQPDDLIAAAGGDLALVLRRLGVVDPGRGLVVCDASGALLRRKPVAGFALPVMGAGCPLWPLYATFAQPGHPMTTVIETPDGAGWRVHAVAEAVTPPGFGQAPVLQATMLLTRSRSAGAGLPVGPGCRVCPRADCAARREPSVLSGGVMLDSGSVSEDTSTVELTGGEAGHD